MLHKPLNQILGAYEPAFFTIFQDIDMENENIYALDKYPVFFHEYVHYLQDISTVNGLANICNLYNLLRTINDLLSINKSSKERKLPIDVLQYEHIKNWNNHYQFTYGDAKIIDIAPPIITLESEEIDIDQLGKTERLILKFDKFSYLFGTRDILEGHAYLLEKLLYPDAEISPDLPYRTVEIIAAVYSDWIINHKAYLAVLCEISLSSTNPTTFFLHKLFKIKEKRFSCESVDEFVTFITENDDNTSYSSTFGKTNALDEIFEKLKNDAVSFVIDPVKNPSVKSAGAWAKSVIEKAYYKRKKDFIFISRGLFAESPNQYYFDLINDLSCPIIFDNAYNTFSLGTNDLSPDTSIFYSLIFYVINLFIGTNGNNKCKFVEYCKNQKNEDTSLPFQVNENCNNFPLRNLDKKHNCPLTYLLKSWGFDKYTYEL